jgi:hypothetical protein
VDAEAVGQLALGQAAASAVAQQQVAERLDWL